MSGTIHKLSAGERYLQQPNYNYTRKLYPVMFLKIRQGHRQCHRRFDQKTIFLVNQSPTDFFLTNSVLNSVNYYAMFLHRSYFKCCYIRRYYLLPTFKLIIPEWRMQNLENRERTAPTILFLPGAAETTIVVQQPVTYILTFLFSPATKIISLFLLGKKK